MLTFGILLATGSRWAWIGVAPCAWFVGMVFSHIIFKRCVLNEIVIRLSRFKKTAEIRAANYQPKRPPMAKYSEVRSARAGTRVLVPDQSGVLVARLYDEI